MNKLNRIKRFDEKIIRELACRGHTAMDKKVAIEIQLEWFAADGVERGDAALSLNILEADIEANPAWAEAWRQGTQNFEAARAALPEWRREQGDFQKFWLPRAALDAIERKAALRKVKPGKVLRELIEIGLQNYATDEELAGRGLGLYVMDTVSVPS